MTTIHGDTSFTCCTSVGGIRRRAEHARYQRRGPTTDPTTSDMDRARVAAPPVQCLVIPVYAGFGVPFPPLRLESHHQTDEGALAAAIHDLVGGWFQVVRCAGNGSMYLNEDGKQQGLVENIVATRLARDAGLPADDYIVGPAVVVGPPDEAGYDTSVPKTVIRYVEQLGCRIERTEK
jgi:hypothetical protein